MSLSSSTRGSFSPATDRRQDADFRCSRCAYTTFTSVTGNASPALFRGNLRVSSPFSPRCASPLFRWTRGDVPYASAKKSQSHCGTRVSDPPPNRTRRCRATWEMPDFMRFVLDRNRARRCPHVGPYLRDGLRAVKNLEQAPPDCFHCPGIQKLEQARTGLGDAGPHERCRASGCLRTPKPASEMPGHMGDAGLQDVCARPTDHIRIGASKKT